MTLTIDLTPAEEAQLQVAAAEEGIPVQELARRVLTANLPSVLKAQEMDKTLALIEQWISEAPTDPERIQEAEDDLREFQQAINQTRRESGARLIYKFMV